MKSLIVNADDFGWSERRNEGILEAHARGIVTSASLLATGSAFENAVERAKAHPSLDVGLHLNLSEGRPLLPGHRTLVNERGDFLGKQEARRRAGAGDFDAIEVEAEILAQLKKLREAGLRVTHLDGHQHIHVYGSVVEPVAKACVRNRIRFVRRPAESEDLPPLAGEIRRAEIDEYRALAAAARATHELYRLRAPDHFFGIALSGLLTLENLIASLKALPPGVTELMVHPGRADAPDGFSGPDRDKETEALTDPRVRILLRQEGIELTDFVRIAF